MGAFDIVRCEYPLPIPCTNKPGGYDFQTHAMPDECGATYRIDKDGALFNQDGTRDTITPEIDMVFGEDVDGLGDVFVEYSVRFMDGDVSGVSVIEYTVDQENRTEEYAPPDDEDEDE